MSAMHTDDLIQFWKRCDLTQPPFMHPDDRKILESDGKSYIDKEPKDFEAFVSSSFFGDFTDSRLHLSLLPSPYVGDLRKADIFVLSLNPGLSFEDYYAETRVAEFRHRLEQTLRQDLEGVEFPFIFLDPEFCWHGGFRWWERKLRNVVTKIAKDQFRGKYLDALRDVSKRLASLELIPYHSRSFKANGLIGRLPSVSEVRRFAKEVLISAAKRGDKTVVVIRKVRKWELPPGIPNLILYCEASEAQGASLGPESRGGKAILSHYLTSSGVR